MAASSPFKAIGARCAGPEYARTDGGTCNCHDVASPARAMVGPNMAYVKISTV